MKKKYPPLGKALKRARQREKITAYKLCKLANVDASYYSKIENKNKLPGLKTMIRIANVLESSNLLYYYVFKKYPELVKLWDEAIEITKRNRPDMPLIRLSGWVMYANKKGKKRLRHLARNAIKAYGKKPDPKLISKIIKKLQAIRKAYEDYIKFCSETFEIEEEEVLDQINKV